MHAHVDPGSKLGSRSLKIYAALDYGVGIFWGGHAQVLAYFEDPEWHILGWPQVLVHALVGP